MYTFTPRRPVKSFQDLEVYQKLLAVSVIVTKRIKTIDDGAIEDSNLKIGNRKSNPSSTFNPQPLSSIFHHLSSNIVKIALDLPVKIATAHSLRFSDQVKAIATLEEVMLDCNLLIVYLEQYRDIYNVPVPNVPPPKLPDIKSKSLPKAAATTAAADLADIAIIEIEFFEEQIKILLATRFKVMHLQMSWKKFMKEWTKNT